LNKQNSENIIGQLTDVEKLSILIAGISVDLGQPGIIEDYFNKSMNIIALEYYNVSVLQNNSINLLKASLKSTNLLANFSSDE